MYRAILFWAVLGSFAAGQGSVEGWRADLRYLAEHLPKRHKAPFTVIEEGRWRQQVAALDARLEDLEGAAAFEVALLRLLALLGDSHTSLRAQALASAAKIPLSLRWFSDGLYVMEAPRDQRALLGGKVLRLGKTTVAAAVRLLGTVVVFDNESRLRAQVPGLVRIGSLLHAVGIAGAPDRLELTLERRGQVGEHEVAAGGFGRFPARRGPTNKPVTAWREDRWHHHQFLEDEGLLYIQYNRCATSTAHDLGKFTNELVDLCSKGDVKTLVFDLQYNGGGNSALADMLFLKLARHAPLRTRKNVFCVIGRRTFSSAILNASSLRSRYGAVLVGEPTGGSPNHFGEVKSFELPHTKLQVFYSTKRFERGPIGAKTMQPDQVVEQSYADFVSGKDPVLERIRSLVR